MLNIINETKRGHIITIEDPIEYFHEHKRGIVNQREIGVDVPDFAEGLRRALRQDPDVILVGEMRDLATMETAITAAETGTSCFRPFTPPGRRARWTASSTPSGGQAGAGSRAAFHKPQGGPFPTAPAAQGWQGAHCSL